MEIFFSELDQSLDKAYKQSEQTINSLIQSIEKAKAKLIKLGESITDGFFMLDNYWRFTYLNRQTELLWRRTRDELLGKVIWKVFPEAVGSEIYINYMKAVNEQVDVHFETLSPAFGIWVEIHAYPSSEGLLVVFRDITQKRERQAYWRLVEEVVSSSQDAIITGTLDGIITNWNPGAEALYGFSREEAIGQHIRIFIVPERYRLVDEILGRIAKGERVSNYYAQQHNKSGELILTSVSIFPLGSSTGNITGFAAIMRDITDHIVNEQELQHFFNLSTDIMMIADYNGRIIRTNKAFCDILGYSFEEVIGHKIKEFTSEKEILRFFAVQQEMFTHRTPIKLYEVPWKHRDGSLRLLQWNAVPVKSRGYVYAVARDLTDQRRLEQDLARSQRRSNKILDSIKDGFFAIDHNWKVTYINRIAREMAGNFADKVIGSYLGDIFPNITSSTVYQQFVTAIEQQIPLNFECWVDALKGWYEFNIYPTSNGGLLVYYYDLSEVINSRRQLQRLERLQLVNQMAAGISHEIRNPITAVRGFLQVLQENQDYKEHNSYFEVMIDELDRANSIITEFLDLAKDKPTQLSLVNINQVLERLLPLLDVDMNNRGHRMEIQLSEIPELMLNEGEMRQLILNLVRNAAEAMAQPGQIIISTYMQAGRIVLSVRDQGCGIPPEIMDKIGTPFFTTKEKGTGLGLATCFSIVKRNGGEIQIDSSPMGTEIRVSFILSPIT